MVMKSQKSEDRARLRFENSRSVSEESLGFLFTHTASGWYSSPGTTGSASSDADQPRQEVVMRESRFELSVGESVRIDNQVLTVIDITGDEITFRMDIADGFDFADVVCSVEVDKPLVPR